MGSLITVARPPPKPVMIYDGDCNFCRFWIKRFQINTRDSVDYIPFQDPTVAERFPELPRDSLQRAVHLVLPDGSVYSAAEAAFRCLAVNPHNHWLLDWYINSQGFARVSERCYAFIASHRGLFSTLTRFGWGTHVEPPSHLLVRALFLRSLGIIYLIAFVSLWVQIRGLVGSHGILPATETMDAVRQQLDAHQVGYDRYHVFPTLCWFSSSDRFLNRQCIAGVVLSLALIVGLAPTACLFLLWLIYLSLSTICRDFLGFQWDILLLETGFLAIFFAPLQFLPRLASPPPSRLVLWLLRLLLFRLMFESGCVKLLSHDTLWKNLTALTVHYETQPLPTWIGWYAHQLPVWMQKVSTVTMFIIELAVPFLIFAPRRPRQVACVAFVVLQIAILLTGNYCFFNLLAIALCLLLLDDAALQWLFPFQWVSRIANVANRTRRPWFKWPRPFAVPLALVVIAISLIQFVGMFSHRSVPVPTPIRLLYSWLIPLRSFNSYGLFAVMTPDRPEIIIEGSNDGITWLAYEFKYKPGDLNRRPGFVEPHQPRLDWQMWFAALSDLQHNPWFASFCIRLLQGSPEVLALLERNPFPDAPPRFIRAMVYDYRFTNFATRRKTAAWWRRELRGVYMPPHALSPP